MKRWPLILFLAFALHAEEQELKINLKDPTFHQGIIATEAGGIIVGENLRIQARKMEYTNRVEEGVPTKKIIAEGDLLLEYAGRAFIGKKLEYDFVSKRGTVWDGRTSTEYWFLGGDTIELEPDGSFSITNAFITTVEGQNAWWELRSSSMGISDGDELSARGIRFKFFDFPVFWLPSFKMDLNWLKDSPIRYKFIWDQVLKQKVSMRYEVYSTELLKIFGRFDYQFKHGPGGAIETDYHTRDGRTLFLTKTYGAFNKIVPQERGDKRFRLQGLLTTHSKNEKTHVHLSYDRLSDDKMPQDFKSDDFEVNTQLRTILWATHYEDNFFSRFNLQPRINRFQSINQQLPYVTTGIRPFQLGSSGIISDNWFSAGYLDYVFGKALNQKLHSTHAGRLETNNFLYRPFSLGPVNFNPSVGAIGIFYTNNPEHQRAAQGILSYGCDASLLAQRSFTHVQHTLEPYLKFQGLTHPTSGLNHHFIFNLDDGYDTLNLLRAGVRQSFFSTKHPVFLPNFALDLYTYAYFGPTTFHQTVPKGYASFEIRRPSIFVRSTLAYNFQQQLWDCMNIRTDWTASEFFAFGVEFRHRSRFDWQKADHENFILDVARPISNLLHTPISDGRNTLLGRFFLRFSPTWTLHFESHHGWGRKNEPRYNEFTLKLATLLTGKWQLELGLSYDPAKKWEAIYPSIRLIK
jgi:hypothetical protein